jgi:hypothetical protein
MTIAKAISKAMAVFDKAKPEGSIRVAELWECSGSGKKVSDADIHISYAINGDYSESDSNPFVVRVRERDGKITAEIVD